MIDAQEMYGEHFDIPAPDELVFVSSFAGGEVFRGGCCFAAAPGRIFYFSPGDQDYPIYHHPDVRRVIANAVQWAAPRPGAPRAVPGSPESPRGWFGEGVSGGEPAMRVGVIGVGWAGQQHIAAYDALPGVAAGRASPAWRSDRARSSPREYGIEHSVARWEDLLELDGLDAVSVAVPTFLHAPIAIAALERGLHVLSEKPIALNGREADAMVAAARAAGRVLDVAFNHRQRGDIQKLKQVIDAGRLGHPYYAKAWWLRRTGIPTLGQLVHAGRARGRRAAGGHRRARARLLAVPARQPGGGAGQRRRPTTCSATAGLRVEPGRRNKTGANDDNDVRRRGPRPGVHAPGRRRHAARRGQLGRAPRATATSSASRSTAPTAAPS